MRTLTPDGVRYLRSAHAPVARPFHLRWLLPRLLGSNERRWTWTTRAAVLSLAPLAWWYTGSPWMGVCALLPGVAFNWRHPVLVDAVGMALALLAACLWPVNPWAALIVVVIAGCVRETAPVWAAVYAWEPLLALGLVPVVLRWSQKPGNDPCGYDDLLAHPVQSSRKFHAGHWLDWRVMLAPWGGLIVGFAAFDLRLGVALGLGYAQLLIATDSVRLYQWAWPVLALACVHAVPSPVLPFVALAVALNPWKGEGL